VNTRRLLDYAECGFWLSVPASGLLPILLRPILGEEAAIRVYLCYVGVILAVLFWMGCRRIAREVKEHRARKREIKFYESDEGKRFLAEQAEQAERWRQIDNEQQLQLQKKREREKNEFWDNVKNGTGGNLLPPDPHPQ
jgi:hypothetical protein